MKQNFIYTIKDGEITKVYDKYEKLLELGKLRGYYFTFKEVQKDFYKQNKYR